MFAVAVRVLYVLEFPFGLWFLLKNWVQPIRFLLDSYPSLRQQDLNNAWAYYKANKKEIDTDIKENNQA
jgi:hypothetical protein